MIHRIVATVVLHIKDLFKASKEDIHLLLAVSAGSDSVALLHIIHSIKEKLKFKLSVVTVNHNIRDEKISKEDANFVSSMCASFSEKIPCMIAEISKKEMQETIKKRGKGVEEAARFLRRKAYERARSVFGATHILTAHTKDDFFEGVLMSFFSGASSTSLLGMKVKNGHYIKPLLHIEKHKLRQYLLKKGITWREDATNSSLKYLRNRVRLSLIPHINEVFPGWHSGLQKTLHKLAIDEKYLKSSYQSYIKHCHWQKNEEGLCVDALKFLSMPRVFALRFLQEGFVLLNVKERISYNSILTLLKLSLKRCKIQASGILLYIKEDKVILTPIKKQFQKTSIHNSSLQNSSIQKVSSNNYSLQETSKEVNSRHGYLFWIDKRDFNISFGKHSLKVRHINENKAVIFFDDTASLTVFLPFCIRSRMIGDFITINGKKRTLKTLFSKMKVSSKMSALLPIVECNGMVRAVYAGIIDKKNLIGEIENK